MRVSLILKIDEVIQTQVLTGRENGENLKKKKTQKREKDNKTSNMING